MDLFDPPIASAEEAEGAAAVAPHSPPQRDGYVAAATLDAATKRAVWVHLRRRAPADAAFLAHPAIAGVIQHFKAIVWIRTATVEAALIESATTEENDV